MDRKDFVYLLIFFSLALLSTWRILITYGVIGYRHDWSYPQYGELISHQWNNWFYAWSEEGLGYNPSYSSTFFYNLIITTLSSFGVGGVVITKILIFSFIFFSGAFMFLLMKQFVKDKFAFYSGLFFMLNPVIFNKIITGQVVYLFGYALMPLAFLFFIRKRFIISGLLTTLVFSQPQFIIIFSGLLILFSLFFKGFKGLFFTLLIAFACHSFWLIPALSNLSIIKSAVSGELLINRSLPIPVVSLLIGYYYFINALSDYFILWLISGVSLLSLMLINIKSKNKIVWFSISLSLIGLFLAKGSSPPLGWVFNSIPFIGLFRETQHLLVIPAFGYSLLIGFSAKHLNRKSLILLPLILVFGLPFLSGNLGGQVQQFTWGDDYANLVFHLINDPADYRVLWYPMNQPMMPVGLRFAGVDPLINYSPKPSFNQMISSFSDANQVTAFLYNTINFNASNPKQLLNLLGVKYVFYRNDFKSYFHNFSYARGDSSLNKWVNQSSDYFASFLNKTYEFNHKNIVHLRGTSNFFNDSNQSCFYDILNITFNKSIIDSFINNDSLPLVYAADKSILLSDDLNGLLYDFNSSRPVIFFAAQSPINLINLTDEVILVNDDFSVMNYSNKFVPADYVGFSNASAGWARLFDYSFGWWWFNLNYSSVIGDSVLSLKPNSSLIIPFNINSQGYLFIKGGGDFIVSFNNKSIHINSGKIHWLNISFINDSGLINITNLNESFISELRVINSKFVIHNKSSNQSHNSTIIINKANPTHYTITTNNSRPFFLILSESFNKDWAATINGTTLPHFKANGFANAWYVNETGSNKITIIYHKQVERDFFSYLLIIELFFFILLFFNKEIYIIFIFSKSKFSKFNLINKILVLFFVFLFLLFNFLINRFFINFFFYLLLPVSLFKIGLQVNWSLLFKNFNKKFLPLISLLFTFLICFIYLLPTLLFQKYYSGFLLNSDWFFILFLFIGLIFFFYKIDSHFLILCSFFILWFCVIGPINQWTYFDLFIESLSVFALYFLITGFILELLIINHKYKPLINFKLSKLNQQYPWFITLVLLSFLFNIFNLTFLSIINWILGLRVLFLSISFLINNK